MTVEQKAKAYDKALEKAKIWQEHLYDVNDKDYADELNYIFPELSESDDERIRRVIRGWIYTRPASFFDNGISKEVMLAWLEKQGEYDIDCPKNHQDSSRPNGCIVLEDFNGGEGFYKLNLDYLNKRQVEEVEEMVRTWNKESKTSNENIKNCIGMCLTDVSEQRFKDYNTNLKDCLAWLEKQGEQKQDVNVQINPSEYINNIGGNGCYLKNTTQTSTWSKKEEKVDNQNCVKSIYDVKPKFKVGDWISNDMCDAHIASIEDGMYYFDEGDGLSIVFVDEHYHLWTIEDAMDGDVLFHSDSASNGIFIFKEIIDKGFAKGVICYCDYDSEDHFCLGEHHTCCWTNAKILYPATKEQRDTLFAKMKEAGYIFDFEKKELKKIETEIEIPFGAKDSELQEATYYIPKGFHAEIDDDDKVVIKKGEKPAAWSKKDEKMFKYALNMIEWYSGKNEDKSRFVSDWLKSIKQRIGG